VNASPLIFLSKANLLELLQLASEEIVVPVAVATEIQRRGQADVTVQALERTPWLTVVTTPQVASKIRDWDLGEGESAVLAWAYAHPGTEAIVDDLAARRCATTLDMPIRGTLGLVLTAKQKGIIPAARPILEKLR
jgi:predicted nucleic acid-binding protein